MNFLVARPLRLVALDIFLPARQWLLQFMRARAAAPAADETGYSVALGVRPRPARVAPARRSKPPRRACSPRPWSRRPFAQVPWGSSSTDNASANGLLQLQRSGGAASEAVAAHGRGLGRHRPYACAPFCAMHRAREGREGRPRAAHGLACFVKACVLGDDQVGPEVYLVGPDAFHRTEKNHYTDESSSVRAASRYESSSRVAAS